MRKIILFFLLGLCLILSIGCKENSFSIDVSGKDITNIVTDGHDRLCYEYKDPSNGTYHIVICDSKGNKDEYGPYTLNSPPVFFYDDNTLAYVAKSKYKFEFYLNGEKKDSYNNLNIDLTLFYNRNMMFFVVENTGKFYITNGRDKFGPYDNVGEIKLSLNGKRISYPIQTNGEWRLTIDNKTVDTKPDLFNVANFSPDGSVFAFWALYDNEWFIVKNNEKIKTENKTKGELYGVIISPDNKTMAYSIQDSTGLWYLIIGNKKMGPYERCFPYSFTQDGKNLIYSAKIDGKYYIFDGDKKIGPYENVSSLASSTDGKKIAYFAVENGKSYLFYDNKKTAEYFSGGYKIHFSNKNNILAYNAIRDDEELCSYVVIDGISYIGDAYKDKVAYLKDGKIIVEVK
ncbi:hypothetical protein [Treponema putidum]|uniref:hypothetical protein n=1 Tax=Treponema putidum TaxID=221027 RepID=UPI003D94BF7A